MSFRSEIGGMLRSIKSKFFRYRTLSVYPRLEKAFSIESHVTPEERLQLFKLAKNKTQILEIGSYLGCSATCFGAMLSLQGKGRIFCIDTWQNDAMTEGSKDTYQAFMENTKEFRQFIVPVKGFSTEVVTEVRKQTPELDMLFIDGDHSYEGAKNDWDAYKNFLHPGSVVIFHDYGWAEGVKRVIEEDARPITSDSGSLPNLWWGTIG